MSGTDRSTRWHIQRLQGGLGAHRAAWQALGQAQLGGGHPLLEAEFTDGLLRHFGGDEVYLCRDGDAPGGAMCILQPGRLGVWRSFLPSQAQIGPTLIQDAWRVGALFEALPGTVNAIEFLCCDVRYGIGHLDQADRVRTLRHAVTMSIPLEGGYEAYWARRSKNLRHNLRRYERRAAEVHGELELRVIDAPDAMAAAVDRYAALEGQGWKGDSGTALASSGSQFAFYRSLMCAKALQGEALVYELWAGGTLAASRLLVVDGHMLVILKTTFDEAQREWAPGRVHLRRVVEDAFARFPGRLLEFYTNANVDQLAWADSQRSIVHVSFYRDRKRLWAAGLRQRLRRSPAGVVADTEAVDTVECVTDAAALSPAARHLLQAAEASNLQSGEDWYRLLHETAAGAAPGTLLLAQRRGALPVAALPVNLDPALQSRGFSVGALANYYTTLYEPVLAEDTVAADLAPLLQELRRRAPPATPLVFSPMDPQARSFGVLRAALVQSGFAVFDFFAHGNWYLPVNGSWATHLQSRPGALRSTVQRMGRRLESMGARLEIVTDPDQVEPALQAYEAVYTRSWKPTEAVPDFVRGLVRLAARRGWLRLGLLWLEGRPVAAQLWLVHGGRALIYKLAYDEQARALAPGTVLTAHLMQRAIDVDRVTEIDYLVGDDPYKRDWMSHRRERRGLVAYDLSTWSGRWLAMRSDLWSRLRRRRAADTPPSAEPS